MAKKKEDETIYVGVLVRHLEEIVTQLNVVIAAARQLGGRRMGPIDALQGTSIDPGNILVDGKCQVSLSDMVRAYSPSDERSTVRESLKRPKKR